MPTGWGFYMQGSDQQIEVEELGTWLNNLIRCPVHYPAWAKPVYECECGVLFPLYGVKYAKEHKDIAIITNMHNEGYKPEDGTFGDNGKINKSEVRYSENEH